MSFPDDPIPYITRRWAHPIVWLVSDKKGEGVGARISLRHAHTQEYLGTLTFHEGGDWQVTDRSQVSEQGWDFFESALQEARRLYPKG